MTNDAKTVEVEIATAQGSLTAQGKIESLALADAIKKAGKFYAGSLVFALICAFIPLVHFIAVPAVLLGGPLISGFLVKFYRGKQDITVDDARCPQCHRGRELSKVLEAWPLRERCPHCQVLYQARVPASH